MVGYLSSVQAVTDAELEALEKQLEQQEVEEIQRDKAEAKKKAEAEAKRKAEVEKQRLEEIKRIAEEKRMAEEARLAEIERQNKEEAAKKRVEEEKKDKYRSLIAEAGQAVSNKDKELAMSKYNEALALYPSDTVANSGMKEAEKLMDKVCYAFLGKWVWVDGFKDKMEILENGTIITSSPLGDKTFHWTCIPENRQLKHDRIETKKYKTPVKLKLKRFFKKVEKKFDFSGGKFHHKSRRSGCAGGNCP